jgi:hypothetical protein
VGISTLTCEAHLYITSFTAFGAWFTQLHESVPSDPPKGTLCALFNAQSSTICGFKGVLDAFQAEVSGAVGAVLTTLLTIAIVNLVTSLALLTVICIASITAGTTFLAVIISIRVLSNTAMLHARSIQIKVERRLTGLAHVVLTPCAVLSTWFTLKQVVHLVGSNTSCTIGPGITLKAAFDMVTA